MRLGEIKTSSTQETFNAHKINESSEKQIKEK